MANTFAVSRTSGANSGESPESLSRIRTAVTTFVLTPVQMCALIQMDRWRVMPYFWSYQRSNLLVPNPLESMANFDSTAFSGAALVAIRAFRIGVNAGLSRKV